MQISSTPMLLFFSLLLLSLYNNSASAMYNKIHEKLAPESARKDLTRLLNNTGVMNVHRRLQLDHINRQIAAAEAKLNTMRATAQRSATALRKSAAACWWFCELFEENYTKILI
jgi:hypothetical protein